MLYAGSDLSRQTLDVDVRAMPPAVETGSCACPSKMMRSTFSIVAVSSGPIAVLQALGESEKASVDELGEGDTLHRPSRVPGRDRRLLVHVRSRVQ